MARLTTSAPVGARRTARGVAGRSTTSSTAASPGSPTARLRVGARAVRDALDRARARPAPARIPGRSSAGAAARAGARPRPRPRAARRAHQPAAGRPAARAGAAPRGAGGSGWLWVLLALLVVLGLGGGVPSTSSRDDGSSADRATATAAAAPRPPTRSSRADRVRPVRRRHREDRRQVAQRRRRRPDDRVVDRAVQQPPRRHEERRRPRASTLDGEYDVIDGDGRRPSRRLERAIYVSDQPAADDARATGATPRAQRLRPRRSTHVRRSTGDTGGTVLRLAHAAARRSRTASTTRRSPRSTVA